MCFSRHNGVYFFDISTSKSGPNMWCFYHFDFDMCFAPQRRARFRHLNFQKWSEPGVLCTFWLRNVLRATTVCNFSSLIWPAGSAPANTVFRDFPTFSRAWIFFWDFLFLILLLLLLSSHLCFSSVHIVGSLASKLPSVKDFNWNQFAFNRFSF